MQLGKMALEVATNSRDPSANLFEELRLVGGKVLSARLRKQAVRVSFSGVGQRGC